MSIVIIAEKHDAAVAIAKALSPTYIEHKGYMEGSNHINYTYAQGHLLKFLEPGELKEEWEEWSWESLPIIPTEIRLKPIKGQSNQLAVIAKLTRDCDLIVNAMDSAQEGELIYFYISLYLNLLNKPTKRLWTASLQAAAIQKAFKEMKDISEYQNLRNAAICRSLSDYIVGTNASRSLTLAGNGKTLPAGRVLAPVLSLIYDREQVRSSFEQETYYSLKSYFKLGEFQYIANYKGERLTDVEKVQNIVHYTEKNEGAVKVEDKQKTTLQPGLLNHSDVLIIANQRFGFKGVHTAKILQNLYLKKLITYPRTKSKYLTPSEMLLMRTAYRILSSVYPNLEKGGDIDRLKVSDSRIFNVEEIEDHHAILPEAAVPADLTKEEQEIYHLIVERFFLQFQEPMESLHRKVITTVGDTVFQTTFKEIVKDGWKGLELNFDHTFQEDLLDDDEEEDIVVEKLPTLDLHLNTSTLGVEVKERKTQPPALYTEGTLIRQMENVGNLIGDPKFKDILKGIGIGTSSTRAETIKKLIDVEYITTHKKKLEITSLGKTVVELLRRTDSNLLTSPELTARWELELDAIKKGKDAKAFQDAVISFTTNFIDNMRTIKLNTETLSKFSSKCPNCGKIIRSNKNMYFCADYKNECSFFIWKNQYGKTITERMLEDLLSKGETSTLSFKTKDGARKYKAKLKLPNPLEKGKVQLAYL